MWTNCFFPDLDTLLNPVICKRTPPNILLLLFYSCIYLLNYSSWDMDFLKWKQGENIGCFFKFHLIVGVKESLVNALYRLWIRDQLFSYVLHEWCVHNRLFNAYYEVKFKKHPIQFQFYTEKKNTGCLVKNASTNNFFIYYPISMNKKTKDMVFHALWSSHKIIFFDVIFSS
jgi:hypothetical protein